MKPTDLINIKITYGSERALNYSLAIEELLEDCCSIAEKGKPSGFKRLQRAIKKYPTVPEFKYFLTYWYLVRDEDEKAFKWNQRIVKAHPEFLIARIDLADKYLQRFMPEKVVELFNESFDLKQLFPKLKEIHVVDALMFLDIACKYFIQLRNFERAEIYLERMVDLDPKSQLTQNCISLLMVERILKRKEEEESIYSVETAPPPETFKTTPPNFTHRQIELLYETNELSQSDLNYLYALPRESLIKDLEMVIKDGWERYSYFLYETEIEEENTYFVFHAIMLLAALKATESYPVILEFLSQNDELIEFHLDYFTTEYIWQVHYDLGQKQIDRLLDFMKKPKIDTFSKTEISVAIVQMLLHNKITREQALAFYEEILLFFLEATLEDEVIDATLIGLIIGDIIDVKLSELKDLMYKLYEKDYVDTTVNGPWQSVKNELEDKSSVIEALERERNIAYTLE